MTAAGEFHVVFYSLCSLCACVERCKDLCKMENRGKNWGEGEKYKSVKEELRDRDRQGGLANVVTTNCNV